MLLWFVVLFAVVLCCGLFYVGLVWVRCCSSVMLCYVMVRFVFGVF